MENGTTHALICKKKCQNTILWSRTSFLESKFLLLEFFSAILIQSFKVHSRIPNYIRNFTTEKKLWE